MKREGRLPTEFSDLVPVDDTGEPKPPGPLPVPQAFDEQRQRFLLSGGRSNSLQCEKLSYPPLVHFTSGENSPARITKPGLPRCNSTGSPVPLTPLTHVARPATGTDAEAAAERDGFSGGLPGLEIPSLREGINWSIPSEDDGDNRAVFGTMFLW
jgi:hypothetical protein